MDFIRLYGFGRSILIFVKYALVQAQQKKVQCKDNRVLMHSEFSPSNQCRLLTYFFIFTARTLLN